MRKVFIFCFFVFLVPLVVYGDENTQVKETSKLSEFLIDIGESSAVDPDADGPLILGGKNRTVPGIQVYDSDSNYLGVLINMSTLSTGLSVYNDNLRSFLEFDQSDGTLKGYCDPYFEDIDCSGIPYIEDRFMYFISRSSQETYYTGKRIASIADFKPKSYINIYGICTLYNVNDRTISAVPAIEVPSSELVHFTPVKLPFRYKGQVTVITK